jgi:hypothetical protein
VSLQKSTTPRRYSNDPSDPHLEVAKSVLKYFQRSRMVGIMYSGQTHSLVETVMLTLLRAMKRDVESPVDMSFL